MLALGAVAQRYCGTEDARENLPADKKAQGEVHVRGRDSAQGPEYENAETEEKQVISD